MWENWILETRTILPRTILPRQFLPNVKLVRHIAALSLPILDYRIQVQQKKKMEVRVEKMLTQSQ